MVLSCYQILAGICIFCTDTNMFPSFVRMTQFNSTSTHSRTRVTITCITPYTTTSESTIFIDRRFEIPNSTILKQVTLGYTMKDVVCQMITWWMKKNHISSCLLLTHPPLNTLDIWFCFGWSTKDLFLPSGYSSGCGPVVVVAKKWKHERVWKWLKTRGSGC